MKCGSNSGYESDLERSASEDDEDDEDEENLYPSDQERVIEDEARYIDICMLCNMKPCCTILYHDDINDIISSCNRDYPRKEDAHNCHEMARSMSMKYFEEIPISLENVFNDEWGTK